VAADVAAPGGAVPLPAPYIQVPVDCTVPGLSVMPATVTWWPCVSVTRTVNGPGPAPDAAIQ
jgi:hypothetical protein